MLVKTFLKLTLAAKNSGEVSNKVFCYKTLKNQNLDLRFPKVGKTTLRPLAQPQEHDIGELICKCIENFHLSAEELVSLLWTYCDHEELKHAAEDKEKATNLTKQRRRLLKIYRATTNWPSRYQGRRRRKHEACSVGPHLEQINVEINRTFIWYSGNLKVYPPEHGNSGQDCGHTHPNPWKWAHQ